MVIFFVVTGLLVVLALLFVIPVLWKENKLEADSFDEQNILIARERLKELKQDFDNGVITQPVYDQAKQELEDNLALDLSIGEVKSESMVSASSGKALALVLLLVIPGSAALIYSQLGEFNAV
ncbi:MAG: c-type cytochrome biogenesis protein CcmI, partial [Gammaproteobacteria bacterium]|nr:c-type cytochrome biogenesis protein CcmI [Gammaproteobacteria bacterium]